jgi:DNA-binding transcriptional LysR family regulator
MPSSLDWNDLRDFLAVHRTGNLARAAALRGINATTVSRRLVALESQVGARLFDRTPDGYTMTPAGRDLLPHAERMEREALALERALFGRDQKLSGTVKVTATEMLATRFIAPHLRDFHARYPEISLDLVCTNRSVSLSRREADVALRLSRPDEEGVVARKLSRIELSLYASHTYFERYGVPSDPENSLAGHGVLLFADARPFAAENNWFAQRLEGAQILVRSDSVSSIYAAVVAGLGIALLPRAVADHEPSLRRLVTSSAPEPRIIWQSVHEDLSKSPRVRAVTGYLTEVLGEPSGRFTSM